jgi:hypothetical protein
VTRDTKDWTWVLQERCPECGFDAGDLHREDIGTRVLTAAQALRAAVTAPGARTRPAPDVWSPLEYGCHTRDVCQVFDTRLQLVLTEDDPTFANWDQDATAVADDYAGQDPELVAGQLWEAAQVLAGRFNGVEDPHWDRTAGRSDGARFTVVSLGQYLTHDLVHHVWDLTGVPQET